MRLARAGTAALVCTALAGGAHVAAGGRASAGSLVVVLLGTWMVAAALSERRLATSQLVGLLLLGQAVTHVASPPASTGHDGAMLAAHVLGTVLSALLLRHAEDALWTLADRIALRAAALVHAVTPMPHRPAPVPVALSRTLRPVLLTHVVEGRGPPAGLA